MSLVLKRSSQPSTNPNIIYRKRKTNVSSSYRLTQRSNQQFSSSREGVPGPLNFLHHKIKINDVKVRATAAEETAPPIADASIRVKLMLAEGSGKLDLSECGLTFIPPQVFELTELEELSLAGNNITILPPEIGKLTSLERLQLSGNELTSLPEEIGELQALKGLWVHGNRLASLPDSVSKLKNLVQLSIAGNEIEALPDGIGGLSSLKELAAAGNKIKCLPEELEGLKSLEILGLYGNQLTSLPSSVCKLEALKEFWVQGNPLLTSLPAEIGEMQSLQHFSAADCALEEIPVELGNAPTLKTLSLYGNQIKSVPLAILNAPQLSAVYLEGNPLESNTLSALVHAAQGLDEEAARASSTNEEEGKEKSSPRLLTIGLDINQISEIKSDSQMDGPSSSSIKISEICGTGPGYFKLEKSPELLLSSSSPTSSFSQVLVVAFGSAPGVPNWAGLIKRIRAAGAEPAHNDFDVLYVVDPYRGWYGGGDDVEYSKWEERLKTVTQRYNHVVMIGDSMGATASLLFAGQATSVHAFCPQIDLAASSIRPGKGPEWGAALKQRALQGIAECKGKVTIHVGNWKHDLDQANICPKNAAHVQIYSVESHRLAIALDRTGKLLPPVRAAILNEMGLSANNVRVSNLF